MNEALAATSRPNSRRFQFTLRQGILAVTVVAVLFGVGRWLHDRSTLHDRRDKRLNNLEFAVFGLRQYEETFRTLPPPDELDRSGRRISSWRFQIMRFLDGGIGVARREFELPWDDVLNRDYAAIPANLYCVPRDNNKQPNLETRMLAITGPDTAFDQAHPRRMDELDPDQILLIEVRRSGLHWMQPGDLDVRQMPQCLFDDAGKSILGLYGDGIGVAFADGNAWLLSSDVPIDILRKFFTIEGAKASSREELLEPFRIQ